MRSPSQRLPTVPANRKGPPREALGRGGAERDDEARIEDVDLVKQPPLADIDLARDRLPLLRARGGRLYALVIYRWRRGLRDDPGFASIARLVLGRTNHSGARIFLVFPRIRLVLVTIRLVRHRLVCVPTVSTHRASPMLFSRHRRDLQNRSEEGRKLPADQGLRPNNSSSFAFAASSVRFRLAGRLRPARLMYRLSIDMAERNGVDLRRSLASAERFKDRAISVALFVKTSFSRSSASERPEICADHILLRRAGLRFRRCDWGIAAPVLSKRKRGIIERSSHLTGRGARVF